MSYRAWVAALTAVMWFVVPPQHTITVHLIGDSTMADKPDPARNPERGWGQALPRFFDSSVVVKNYAVNGRSTKSFIDEGKWDAARANFKRGDFVFIQFGHNDEKSEDTTRFAAADGAYRENIARMIRDAHAAGVMPVLFTPIVRRQWNAMGELQDTHGRYPAVVRELGGGRGVALVDLNQLSADLLRRHGVEPSKALFVWTSEGQYPAFPAARADNTHLSPAGADSVARLAAQALRGIGGPLSRRVRVP